MYGTLSQNAILLIRPKARAINIAVMVKAVNIISAISGKPAPKNANDHNVFKTIFIANKT